MNHCRLYQELLTSVGFPVFDVPSRQFAENESILTSAFTQPAYSVALSQFSQEFFPELLGTTLQIEWSVLSLWPSAELLDHYGYDSHFYHLHIGIDNAAAGHGWRAKNAVLLYLRKYKEVHGEEKMQSIWRRIWNGFLAYDALGNLGNDLLNLNKKQFPASEPSSADSCTSSGPTNTIKDFEISHDFQLLTERESSVDGVPSVSKDCSGAIEPTPQEEADSEVIAMMVRKSKYASKNHMFRKLG